MRTIEHQNLKWIDILNPRDEDMKFLEDHFGFHHLILEEIKMPTYHPLIESYKNYLFLILHFPELDLTSQQIQTAEIDFLITQDALITIRYQKFNDFEEIFEEIKKNSSHYFNKTTGHLFYYIVKQLFTDTFPELDHIKEEIDKSEDQIFGKFDERVIEHIALTKRQILDFIRAVKPQKSTWDTASEIFISFWGERIKPYVYNLIADYNRMLYFAETQRDVIDSLHLTSNSLLDNKRNYVIKILTIFTAIILPLSLIASIYGMNLDNLPLADHPLAFWMFIVGMIIVIILMIRLFRKKKWI